MTRRFCWRLFVPFALVAAALGLFANPAIAEVTVCTGAGEALVLRVSFNAAFENAVIVSTSEGKRIVGFNNFFGRGAGGEWQFGATTWQSQALTTRQCFQIAAQHKAGTANPNLPWQPSNCQISAGHIGFEDGVDSRFEGAQVDVLGGRIEASTSACLIRMEKLSDKFKATRGLSIRKESPAAIIVAPAPSAAEAPRAMPQAIPKFASPNQPAAAPVPTTTMSFQLPEFPFPPPDPSARLRIPRELLVGNADAPSFGSVARRVETALIANGYVELSYFAVPGGFTLVTQLERINADATPAAEQRWNIAVAPVSLKSFSLQAYLRALLQKDAGFFRVIVLVFTSEPFTASGKKVPPDEAMKWINQGANTLPADVARLPYDESVDCTALVYEFEISTHGAEPQLLQPSPQDGAEHLQGSGILRSLGG